MIIFRAMQRFFHICLSITTDQIGTQIHLPIGIAFKEAPWINFGFPFFFSLCFIINFLVLLHDDFSNEPLFLVEVFISSVFHEDAAAGTLSYSRPRRCYSVI